MKISDVDILIVPDPFDRDADHWHKRWEKNLSSARYVDDIYALDLDCSLWCQALITAGQNCQKPIVFIAHSFGISAVLHAISTLQTNIIGCFFVAPIDFDLDNDLTRKATSFAPYPAQSLACPSVLIAGETDAYCSFNKAEEFAKNWGSLLLNAGDSGHINASSGYGPWPEGSMVFAQFLSKLEKL